MAQMKFVLEFKEFHLFIGIHVVVSLHQNSNLRYQQIQKLLEILMKIRI